MFQSSQTAFQEQQINGPELDDELFGVFNEDDMPEGMENIGNFDDLFNTCTWNDSDAVGNTSLGHSGVSNAMGGPSNNLMGSGIGSGSSGGNIGMGRGSMGTRGDCSSQPGSPPSSQPCSPFHCRPSSYRVSTQNTNC